MSLGRCGWNTEGWEEQVNLFASSPIGATMQDGGKRKRSDRLMVTYVTWSYDKKKIIKGFETDNIV